MTANIPVVAVVAGARMFRLSPPAGRIALDLLALPPRHHFRIGSPADGRPAHRAFPTVRATGPAGSHTRRAAQ